MTLSTDARDTHDDSAAERPTPPRRATRRRPSGRVLAHLGDPRGAGQRRPVGLAAHRRRRSSAIPYGRTARQVEEVLEPRTPYGVSAALAEVLTRAREHLEANERAEVAHHVRLLLERSGLGPQEFASRIGVPDEEFTA